MSEAAPSAHTSPNPDQALHNTAPMPVLPIEATTPLPAMPLETPTIAFETGTLGLESSDPPRTARLATEMGALSLGQVITGARIKWTEHAIRRDRSRLEREIGPDLKVLQSNATQALEARGTNPNYDPRSGEKRANTFRQNLLARRMWDQRRLINEEEKKMASLAVVHGEHILKEGHTHPVADPRPMVPGASIDIGGNPIAPPKLFREKPDPYEQEQVYDPAGVKRTKKVLKVDKNGTIMRDPVTQVALYEEVSVPVTRRKSDIGTQRYIDRVETERRAGHLRRSQYKTALKKDKKYRELSHEVHERRELLESASHAGKRGHGHVVALKEAHKLRHPVKTLTLRNFRKVMPARKLINDKIAIDRRLAKKQAHLANLRRRRP